MKRNSSKPTIIVIGLRRSGTTAFWKAFRKDSRLCCYDEPFNPNLAELPEENKKDTRKEFINIYSRDSKSFISNFCPISLSEETNPSLTNEQRDYLSWLLGQFQNRQVIVIDSVRINFKLAEIYSNFPNTILVHLYRHPIAWISSHMLPTGAGTWKRPITNLYRKMSFWHRNGFYNNWGYQHIIEQEISNDSHWNKIGLVPKDIKNRPAIFKLAAFWHWAYTEAEFYGKQLWGQRFFSVSFENFCVNPRFTLSNIYKAVGVAMPEYDYSYIKEANHGFRPGHTNWAPVIDSISTKRTTA